VVVARKPEVARQQEVARWEVLTCAKIAAASRK